MGGGGREGPKDPNLKRMITFRNGTRKVFRKVRGKIPKLQRGKWVMRKIQMIKKRGGLSWWCSR